MDVEMTKTLWLIIAPIIVLQLILMTAALISCARAEATRGPKWLWVFIIVFFNLIGSIIYFVAGRRND